MAKDHTDGTDDYQGLIEQVLEAYPEKAKKRRTKHLQVSTPDPEGEPDATTGIASKCDTTKSNIKSIPGVMTVRGEDVLVGTVGFLQLASPAPAIKVPGSDCFLYLSVGNMATLLTITPTASTWSTAVPVPNASVLNGVPLGFQAIFAPTNGIIDADLTNGIHARVGT